jgi:hypothetical protein
MHFHDIENCHWQVVVHCPKRWDGLDPTADPAVRGCATCLKNVYLCNNEDELKQRVSEGKCVAVGWECEGDDETFMGVLMFDDEGQ